MKKSPLQRGTLSTREFIERYVQVDGKPITLRDVDIQLLEFIEKCRKTGKQAMVLKSKPRA
jgi:hypothetical protein